jgi:hypothetical protein
MNLSQGNTCELICSRQRTLYICFLLHPHISVHICQAQRQKNTNCYLLLYFLFHILGIRKTFFLVFLFLFIY